MTRRLEQNYLIKLVHYLRLKPLSDFLSLFINTVYMLKNCKIGSSDLWHQISQLFVQNKEIIFRSEAAKEINVISMCSSIIVSCAGSAVIS